MVVCIHTFVLSPLFENAEANYSYRTLVKRCEMSPLLDFLLIIVSYHWDVTKLIYLATVLDTIRTYETKVKVVVVTDNDKALRRVLEGWGHLNDSDLILQIWQAPSTNDSNKYALLWAHRQAINEQIERYPDYTSIIYIDDTRISWPTLVSWALDTEVLAPLDFTRCIYWTEVDVETGQRNMMDWTSILRLTHDNTLDLSLSAEYARVQARLQDAGTCGCGKHRDGSPWPCQVHDRFLSPQQPYQGLWIASRAQLAFSKAHPYWRKEEALNATTTIDNNLGLSRTQYGHESNIRRTERLSLKLHDPIRVGPRRK